MEDEIPWMTVGEMPIVNPRLKGQPSEEEVLSFLEWFYFEADFGPATEEYKEQLKIR